MEDEDDNFSEFKYQLSLHVNVSIRIKDDLEKLMKSVHFYLVMIILLSHIDQVVQVIKESPFQVCPLYDLVLIRVIGWCRQVLRFKEAYDLEEENDLLLVKEDIVFFTSILVTHNCFKSRVSMGLDPCLAMSGDDWHELEDHFEVFA